MDQSLQAALRLRRLTTAVAQRNLADAIATEAEAAKAWASAANAVVREVAAASALSAGDAAVECLAMWLPGGRAAQRVAGEALERATAGITQARAIRAVARSGEAAVEAVIERRIAAREAVAMRREQATIDEVASLIPRET
jgi:hypothetical protein